MARTRNAGSSSGQQSASVSARSRSLGRLARAAPKNYNVDSSDDSDDPQDDFESHDDNGDETSDAESDKSLVSGLDVPQVPPPRREGRSRQKATGRTPKKTPATGSARSQTTPSRPASRSTRTSNHTASPRGGTKRTNAPSSLESPRPSKRSKTSPIKDAGPARIEKIPNWRHPGIPYEAWTDIFLYAASEGSLDSLDTNWLIHAATTCQAFLEPALAALYRSPAIRTSTKAKRLATLLERQPSETRINYRSKIESLYLDIKLVPQSIIFPLVNVLPSLRELIVFTQSDQPPYRELDKKIRWTYPAELFDALAPSPSHYDGPVPKPFWTNLRSWEWSGKLIGGHVPTAGDIAQVHQSPAFSHLTRLSLTNFQVPSLYKPVPKTKTEPDQEAQLIAQLEDEAIIDSLTAGIAELKSLKHLVFESSTVVTDRLLSQLPRDLVHLELINCWEVTSADMISFLGTHGKSLKTLNLLHNQSLNLEYLTVLAETCPSLRNLRMDLSYYRHHETIDDGDAMYEYALLPHQVPKWPSSLRAIDIEHVRDWSVETAEMFLQSLIDQAGNLPDLRRLILKTILDIPWQSRATMRHEWREKMDKVFLRPYEHPANRRSLQDVQGQHLDSAAGGSPLRKRKTHQAASPSRRSGRLASQPLGRGPRSKGLRHKSRGSQPLYRDPDTDEDEFDVSDESDENNDQKEGDDSNAENTASDSDASGKESDNPPFKTPVQGLCTIVSVTFDNQKVRELQYGMEDFRYADSASEDEWDGDFEDDTAIAF